MSYNDVTGDEIKSKGSSQKYRDNWDAVFGSPHSFEMGQQSGNAVEETVEGMVGDIKCESPSVAEYNPDTDFQRAVEIFEDMPQSIYLEMVRSRQNSEDIPLLDEVLRFVAWNEKAGEFPERTATRMEMAQFIVETFKLKSENRRLNMELEGKTETEDDASEHYWACADMLYPYTDLSLPINSEGQLPGSVVESFSMLLQHWVDSGRPSL